MPLNHDIDHFMKIILITTHSYQSQLKTFNTCHVLNHLIIEVTNTITNLLCMSCISLFYSNVHYD